MAYEQVQKPSSSFVPVQKKVSELAPPVTRVQAKDVTAGEQEQIPLGSTPATDANWLMKHPLFKGNQFLQRVVAPASESESLESVEETLQRQEKGNEAATPYSLPVQAKLTIGEAGDKYEQEADRVASQVVKQINSPEAAKSSQGQSVQRQEEPEEELQRQPSISEIQRVPLPLEVQREAMPEGEELQAMSILQRREAIAGGEATTDMESAINSARGSGQPLEAGLQQSMGQAMRADFSGVKVHTDAQSDQLNQSIQAKAFTTGQDVFFRQGAYDPGSRGGQELIAHELTHVVQQNGGAVQRSLFDSPQKSSASPIQAKLTIGQPGDQYEQEADRVASQVVEQIHAPASAQSTKGQSVQRLEEEPEELQAKQENTSLKRQRESETPNQTGLPDIHKTGTEPSVQGFWPFTGPSIFSSEFWKGKDKISPNAGLAKRLKQKNIIMPEKRPNKPNKLKGKDSRNEPLTTNHKIPYHEIRDQWNEAVKKEDDDKLAQMMKFFGVTENDVSVKKLAWAGINLFQGTLVDKRDGDPGEALDRHYTSSGTVTPKSELAQKILDASFNLPEEELNRRLAQLVDRNVSGYESEEWKPTNSGKRKQTGQP